MNKKTKFKLTNANIRLRYDAQAHRDSNFSFPAMAALFGVREMSAWKWARIDGKGDIPSSKKCHNCGVSCADSVLKWINDGVAMEHYLEFGGELVAKQKKGGK